MKKTLFICFTIIASLGVAIAQNNCKGFGQFNKGLKTQMTAYDKNDKLQSVTDHEVIELTYSGDDAEATSKISITNSKGKKEIDNFTTKIRCSKGNIYLNFKDFMGANPALSRMEGAEMKVTGGDVSLPTVLSVGQNLPDSDMIMEMILNGTPLMKMTFTMKNRKVVGQESITTPAGTFNAFKVTYTMSSSVGMLPESTAAMWFSDGINVKTESYNKKGEKTGYSLLTKFVKP